MGQSVSAEDQRMHARVQKVMGSYDDFGEHLKEANEWYVSWAIEY